MNLTAINISYLIFSSNKMSDISSILWAKDFRIISMQVFFKNQYEEAIIASSSIDNDELRKEAIFVLNHLNLDYAIIKYNGEEDARKIFPDGSEELVELVMYNTDDRLKSYIHNGLSFSFKDKNRYWKPTKKEQFKEGMLVEYLNNNKWNQREVKNPSKEYDEFFRLLIKYDRLRILL